MTLPDSTLRVMAQLRGSTRPHHDEIERVPLAAALASGSVTTIQITLLHRAYLMLHEALEQRLERATCSTILAVWRPEQRRRDDLVADLAELAPTLEHQHGTALLRCADSIERTMRTASADTSRLLGALYVLEGSRLGGAFLAPRIAAAIGLPLRYYAGHGGTTMSAWRAFGARMDAALPEATYPQVIDGAVEMFGLLAILMTAVWEATAISPDARDREEARAVAT